MKEDREEKRSKQSLGTPVFNGLEMRENQQRSNHRAQRRSKRKSGALKAKTQQKASVMPRLPSHFHSHVS